MTQICESTQFKFILLTSGIQFISKLQTLTTAIFYSQNAVNFQALLYFIGYGHQLSMELSNQQNDLSSLANSRQLSSDKSQTKSITRKPHRLPTTQLFKKNKHQNPPLSKDKMFRSTENIRFLKNSHAEDSTTKKIPKYHQSDQQVLTMTAPTLTESLDLTSKPLKQKSQGGLVFNKFSHEQKKRIRECLFMLKDLGSLQQGQVALITSKIRIYIQQLEENNAKLLDINYFFQKELNKTMQEKEKIKKMQKCNKSYCLECRYHLEKENKWKQEKKQMSEELNHLKELIASPNNSKKQSLSSLANSICIQQATFEPSISCHLDQSPQKQQLKKLSEMILQKDEEYLILLNEYNFLDSLNKDLKDRHGKLMQLYKYISIQNRTLLGVKGKLAEKELECARLKSQRDQFKKKIIQVHRRMQEQAGDGEQTRTKGHCKNCKDQVQKIQLGREESLFTLSSISTDKHRSQIQQFESY